MWYLKYSGFAGRSFGVNCFMAEREDELDPIKDKQKHNNRFSQVGH